MTIGNYHYDASSFIYDCSPHFVHFAYKSTGKERDTESGNDYFGARYYASTMGRFLSPDWSKNPQGVPYADYTNPQTLNLYHYMRSNPLGGVDPDGHRCEADFDSFQTPEQRQVHPATDFDRQFGQVMKGTLELGAAAIAGPEVFAAAGEAETGFAALKVGVATLGLTGTAVNGTADVVGGMTKTDTGEATDAVTTVTNPIAASVAIATGSISAGSNAADAATLGKAATDVVSGKGIQNAPEAVSSVGGAIDAAKGALNSAKSFFSSPAPPPAPRPPSTPGCNVKGAC
jgi:RHS repeat-associated protein